MCAQTEEEYRVLRAVYNCTVESIYMQPAPRAVPGPGDADDGAAQAWACGDRDRDAISLDAPMPWKGCILDTGSPPGRLPCPVYAVDD